MFHSSIISCLHYVSYSTWQKWWTQIPLIADDQFLISASTVVRLICQTSKIFAQRNHQWWLNCKVHSDLSEWQNCYQSWQGSPWVAFLTTFWPTNWSFCYVSLWQCQKLKSTVILIIQIGIQDTHIWKVSTTNFSVMWDIQYQWEFSFISVLTYMIFYRYCSLFPNRWQILTLFKTDAHIIVTIYL